MRSRWLILTSLSTFGFFLSPVESLEFRPRSKIVAHVTGNPGKESTRPSHLSGGHITKRNQSPVTRSLNILRIVTFLQVVTGSLLAFAPTSHIISQLGPDRATPLLSNISSSSSLVQIMVAPLLGSIMDRTGRKPIMIVSVGAIWLSNLFAVVSPSVFRICVSKFSSALSRELFVISSQAMLSDIILTNKDQGNKNNSNLLGAAIGKQIVASGSAFFIGCIIAGHLSAYRIEVSFVASLGLGFVTLLTVLLLMKETLPESTTPSNLSRTHGFNGILKQVLRAPLSCMRLLLDHGKYVRILAILLLMQTFPQNGGEFFQILSRTVWNLSTKDFSVFAAMLGVLGIAANTIGSMLVQTMGLRHFTVLAILSSMCNPLGAILYGFRGMVAGMIIGCLGFAQSLGVNAMLVSEGVKSGVSAGELAGEISGLTAILKVIGPIFYGALFTKGREWFSSAYLPFFFNISLALVSMTICLVFLPSS